MHVEVNGTRLWFDVDGSALVPTGRHFLWRDEPDKYWLLSDSVATSASAPTRT